MKKSHFYLSLKLGILFGLISFWLFFFFAPRPKAQVKIPVQDTADSLFSVLQATRTAYTQHIVERLDKKAKILDATSKWEEKKNGIMLPSHMFRYSRDLALESNDNFRYFLKSKYPIDKDSLPSTPKEKEGFEFIEQNLGKNFYSIEELDGRKEFVAIYPDIAISDACVNCHNNHRDSPRDDFILGDPIGGIVVRILLEN